MIKTGLGTYFISPKTRGTQNAFSVSFAGDGYFVNYGKVTELYEMESVVPTISGAPLVDVNFSDTSPKLIGSEGVIYLKILLSQSNVFSRTSSTIRLKLESAQVLLGPSKPDNDCEIFYIKLADVSGSIITSELETDVFFWGIYNCFSSSSSSLQSSSQSSSLQSSISNNSSIFIFSSQSSNSSSYYHCSGTSSSSKFSMSLINKISASLQAQSGIPSFPHYNPLIKDIILLYEIIYLEMTVRWCSNSSEGKRFIEINASKTSTESSSQTYQSPRVDPGFQSSSFG